MKLTTKLVAVGAIGAAAFGVARAIHRRNAAPDIDSKVDSSDLDDPVIITEEVVLITDDDSDDFEVDVLPAASRR